MTTITLDRVVKRYTRSSLGVQEVITAVDHVSMKIAPGEVMVFLGPSGCGKTTLLRLIAGLETADSGCVLYDDVPLEEIPFDQRGIGMVFQERALVPHWKSRRNIGFFLELRKREVELPERLERISEITGIGIEKLLERKPPQLSGGEQQRVAVARALTRDLRVLLFDEPFSNLDAKLRSSARIELKRLLREFPTTAVYVTHDQVEAMALADRIALMNEGRLEQIGTYRQLYQTPINLFVATFIGTVPINLFAGHAQGGRWQSASFGGYPIRQDLPNGTPVILAIRPEFIHLAGTGTPARVEYVTPLFSERTQLVEVQREGERWSLIVPLAERVHAGQMIWCTLDSDGILYFDPVTGRRIG